MQGGGSSDPAGGGEKMKLWHIAGLVAMGLIIGCSIPGTPIGGDPFRQSQPLDLSIKTMTVPPGGGVLIGSIKAALVNDGWKLIVYRGPTVTEAEPGQLTQFDTFHTRYQFFVRRPQAVDRCLNRKLDPLVRYDISLIDNKTGMEALTLDTIGCESDAVQLFMSMLRAQ